MTLFVVFCLLFFRVDAWADITLPMDTIPDFCASPTRTASVTGNWNDTATWGGSSVPGAGAIVKINNGVTVTYDLDSATAIKAVCISGILTWGTSGTLRLVTSELLVYSDGELRIGTSASPFTGAATLEFSGTLDTGTVGTPGTDPKQYGVGLLVIGKLRVYGVVRTPFVRLTAAPAVSATSLSLTSTPTGWASGDEVYLPDSHARMYNASGSRAATFQECQEGTTTTNCNASLTGQSFITKAFDRKTLSANVTTTTASLSSGLTYAHECGEAQVGGSSVCDIYPHVANLTRNIIIKSANAGGTRGHAQFFDQADVDIRYAQILDMGRTTLHDLNCTLYTTGAVQGLSNCTPGTGALTQIGTNQKGRYAIHFHGVRGPTNAGNSGYQGKLIGNVILGSTKWPLSVHNSNYLQVEENVIADYQGPGIMLEEGHENYNLINNNIMMGAYSYVDPREGDSAFGGTAAAGREAAGIWGTGGTNNYITNNVAAGFWNTRQQIVPEVGYKFFFAPDNSFTNRVPLFRGANTVAGTAGVDYTLYDAAEIGFLQFENNEAYGMGDAMTIWHLCSSNGTPYTGCNGGTVKDLTCWNCWEQSYFGYPTYNIIFDGMVVRGDNTYRGRYGWTSGDYKNTNITIRNADIQNVGIAIAQTWGVDANFIYEDSVSTAETGIDIVGYYTPGSGAEPTANRNIVLRNVVHTNKTGATFQTIKMTYDVESCSGCVKFFADTLPQTTTVYNYQGNSGVDFNVYFDEQIAQNVAGGYAPCSDTTTYPEIDGVVCPTGGIDAPGLLMHGVRLGKFFDDLNNWQGVRAILKEGM